MDVKHLDSCLISFSLISNRSVLFSFISQHVTVFGPHAVGQKKLFVGLFHYKVEEPIFKKKDPESGHHPSRLVFFSRISREIDAVLIFQNFTDG